MQILNRNEMKSVTAGSGNPTVCELMPGSCACLLDQGEIDWEGYEDCLDDRYGPEEN